MQSYLRQSTASQSRSLGPFVSDTDFKTVQTGLTINNTDILLSVNGGASAAKNSGGGTHRMNGIYGVTFDATDTATVGELEVSVLVSGALVVFATFVVLEEAVYDMLFAASAAGYNAAQVVASVTGAVGSVAAGGITAASIATGAIDADALATDAVAEIADGIWDEPLAGHLGAGSTGLALSNAGGSGTPPTVAEIADGVWDELLAGHVTAGSAGLALADAADEDSPATIAEAVWALTDGIETGWTPRQTMRIIASTTAGINSGNETNTPNYRNLPNTKGRVSATLDAAQNRTGVTYDPD